jgi:hypothetical protein
VAERVRVREIDDDEGRRLVRIVRRDSGSVVTWRRAQMVLLSAQGMDVAGIAKVAFTSEDRVRAKGTVITPGPESGRPRAALPRLLTHLAVQPRGDRLEIEVPDAAVGQLPVESGLEFVFVGLDHFDPERELVRQEVGKLDRGLLVQRVVDPQHPQPGGPRR